jgi:hypothetical protein
MLRFRFASLEKREKRKEKRGTWLLAAFLFSL